MDYIFTVAELKEILASLKEALLRATANGGVTSYTINSGQGTTTVHQASLGEITAQIKLYGNMLQELEEVETGSNIAIMRDLEF